MSIILPLDIDQFQRSTLHLKGIEVGAYMLLIAAMINSNGSLPDDDRLLARYAKVPTTSWGLIRELISPLFIIQDGVWQHKDVNEIIDKKAKLSSTRSQAAKSPKKNKSLNLLDLTPANAKQNDNKPANDSSKEIKQKRVLAVSFEGLKLSTIPDEWLAFALGEGLSIAQAKRQFEMFGDVWRSNGEAKKNWLATWRNRIRNQIDKYGLKPEGIKPSINLNKLETIAKYIRMVDVLGRTWTLEMSREIGMDENQARLWYKQNQPEQTLF